MGACNSAISLLVLNPRIGSYAIRLVISAEMIYGLAGRAIIIRTLG
jgi:hypothetical protein